MRRCRGERAKRPYSPAEIAGFLALADAQPAPARRHRAGALVCLGAGAGLIRSDLRNVRGPDVERRSGGLVVTVTAGRAPQTVPVLSRYQGRLAQAAAFAGECFLTGGDKAEWGSITNPLTRSLAGGSGLPPLDTSRLHTCAAASTPARPQDPLARSADSRTAAAVSNPVPPAPAKPRPHTTQGTRRATLTSPNHPSPHPAADCRGPKVLPSHALSMNVRPKCDTEPWRNVNTFAWS